VPNDSSQKIWVWFDALANYITALGYGSEDENNFNEFWQGDGARLHVIGKGITRFHAIYWPAMLLSAGLNLPKAIFSHGYLTVNGQKMSKSRGNVINPDEIIKKYGADTVRLYEMFMGPYEDAIAWSTESLEGCARFLRKIWNIYDNTEKIDKETTKELIQKLHYTVKKVSDDIDNMKFNTVISSMMEFINTWNEKNNVLSRKDAEYFLKILAPLAPHITEELWETLGNKKSIFETEWPKYDEKLIKKDKIDLIVQINGKVRDKINVNVDISEKEAKELVLSSDKIKSWLNNQELKKIIFVKGKLINIVI